MRQDVTHVTAPTLEQAGQVANNYATQIVLADYQQRLSTNTFRRQAADLALFVSYLSAAGVVTVTAEELLHNPHAWRGITYGLVDGFVRWMLNEGYAIGSINVRLSTIKAYSKLVTKADIISSTEYALIKLVTGYRHAEGRNIDQRREITRKGPKKANAVSISSMQAMRLKRQPDTPQGRRDSLLMCLLLDHGLRCGEVEALTVQSIDLTEGILTFYRQKVDKTQTHELTRDTLVAAMKYFQICTPQDRLLMGSRKTGVLCGVMSQRAITDRVRVLGKAIGLEGLSAHDCRHYWATAAVKGGTDLKSLQDAGGWNSPAMPLRYAESGKVANQGVKLG
jgi:integrase